MPEEDREEEGEMVGLLDWLGEAVRDTVRVRVVDKVNVGLLLIVTEVEREGEGDMV